MELNMEVQEMPPDGSSCFTCKQPIYGQMMQWFLFTGAPDDPMPTKFKMCVPCWNKPDEK